MTSLVDTTENDAPVVAGVLAEFAGPRELKAAAAELRAQDYTRLEAFSPYPVHGLHSAMGRKQSLLPWLVLVGGFTGCAVGLLLQWWTNAVDYPLLISGKPLFSLPANIPITFELIILFGALAAFGGAIVFCNLPRLHHPLFACDEFRRVTTDAFFLAVDAADPKFDAAATADLLRSLGARSAEVYRRSSLPPAIPGWIKGAVALLAVVALMPPLWILQVRYMRKPSPRVHLILDMDFQPKYQAQQSSPLFADGRAMRPPVAGAVPVDARVDDAHLLRGELNGKPADTFPMPVSSKMMQRGQERYGIFCATCHGLGGDGDGLTSQRAFQREEPKWVKPLSLHDAPVVKQPVGQLYKTITDGVRTMPSYRSQIPVEDRWAIVAYVRALQRSRNASLQDVPEELRKHLEPLEPGHAKPSDAKR